MTAIIDSEEGEERWTVLVLSNKSPEGGVLFDGYLRGLTDDEPLAATSLRLLRQRGVEVHDNDLLFFPSAAPGHRSVLVAGEGFRRGWPA